MTPDISSIRVVAIDDDAIVREALPILLPEIEFAGSFDSVESFLKATPQCDVVLLDLHMPGVGDITRMQGGGAVRTLCEAGWSVLIYSNENRREVLAGCVAMGARGVVAKSEPLSSVANAIESVTKGEIVITQAMIGLAEVAERRGELPTLTNRQREILSARARGESFDSIGQRLFISRRTAEDHWTQVTTKFADYLATHSAADLERRLGIGPGDLLSDC